MLRWLRRPLPYGTPHAGTAVPVTALRPRATVAAAYVRIAGPILGAILVKVLLFGMVAARAAELGAAPAAAHHILNSLALLAAVFGDTVCQAAQVRALFAARLYTSMDLVLRAQGLEIRLSSDCICSRRRCRSSQSVPGHPARPTDVECARTRISQAQPGHIGDLLPPALQAFMPARIGEPAAAWRLARALMAAGVAIAVINAAAGAVAGSFGLVIFTASAPVKAAVGGVLPLFVITLMLHCCSMATEGVLLAAREGAFLCVAYVVAFAIVRALLDALLARNFGLSGCWLAIICFHCVRLASNGARLLRPQSVLSQAKPLTTTLAAA